MKSGAEMHDAMTVRETRAALGELIERLERSDVVPDEERVRGLLAELERLRRTLVQIRESVMRRRSSDASMMASSNARTLQSQLASAAVELATQLKSARLRAEKGYGTVHEGLQELENSKEWSESVRGIMSGLANDVSRIEQVVGVVTDVGKRIRILALNTSILAVRAGELGAAFGVVAREIQALSDRTGETIASVVAHVRTVQSRTEQAAEKTAQSLRKLAEGITVSFAAGDTLDGVRDDVRIAERTVGHMARLVEGVTSVSAPSNNESAIATDKLNELESQLATLTDLATSLQSSGRVTIDRAEIIARLQSITRRMDNSSGVDRTRR